MIESGIIWWLSQHLLITTALVAIVFLLCRVVRPNPATRHIIWLLVLCRLLVPSVATWPWSIPVVVNDTHDMSQQQPTEAKGLDSVLDSVSTLIESRYVGNHGGDEIPSFASRRNVDMDAIVEAEDGKDVETIQRFQVVLLIVGIWVAGALIIAGVLFRRIYRVGQRLKTESYPDDWLQKELLYWCDQLKVRVPTCVIHSKIRSPFLWCLGCVRLVWPLSALNSDKREQVRPILIHELAHLKRRDHWTEWVELFALIVWWWNPALWFVRRQLRVSAEMACDAWVVDLLPNQRRTYAESLVEFSRRDWSFQQAFGVVGANTNSRRTFKRRLEMIMNENNKTRFSKWTALAIMLLGMLSLPTFALKSIDQPEDSVIQSQTGISSDSKLESSPIPKDFIIGAKDVLRINVWKESDLSLDEALVRPDGKISIPLIGDILASGQTPVELKERIEGALKRWIPKPNVTVIVLQIRHQSVSIIGKIKKPGVYYPDSSITVLELLARAGGCSEFADVQKIAIVRKSENQSRYYIFNYMDAVKGKNLENNIALENGDVVIVP